MTWRQTTKPLQTGVITRTLHYKPIGATMTFSQ